MKLVKRNYVRLGYKRSLSLYLMYVFSGWWTHALYTKFGISCHMRDLRDHETGLVSHHNIDGRYGHPNEERKFKMPTMPCIWFAFNLRNHDTGNWLRSVPWRRRWHCWNAMQNIINDLYFVSFEFKLKGPTARPIHHSSSKHFDNIRIQWKS